MSTLHLDEPTTVPWKKLHAFGWPAGSVRALLALLIFGTTWALILLKPEREVPDHLRYLLFIILGHYFAVRRRAPVVDEPGPPPLYLPRGSIRVLTVAGFATVAALLFRRGQLLPIEQRPATVTLALVGGFLFGVTLSAFFAWLRERGLQPPRYVEDVRALVAIAAAVLLVMLVWNRFLPDLLPARMAFGRMPRVRLMGYGPEHFLSAVVGFYFGSRS